MWCGMVWYGIVWYGVVWCGMVWYGMVWCAKACPVQRRSKGQGVCARTGHKEAHAQRRWIGRGGVVWYGMAWFGMVWYGVVWCGMVWYGVVWCAKACQVQRRSNGQGVPMAKASVARQATGRRMHSDVGADTAGERASKHGGWWERGLGQGLSAFMDKFVWTLSEH